ncbi:acyltransferase [Paraburkholderia bonniea]|uniref:acyltransferase family protein n=1 Tax=Paraburkholderia bonniea TaxID=2152891 RepID=UPI001290C830|nr:acyltransferase [Paraburkholderia bonniea]WJF91853.1 acyltransferase [Paraburkholderia bonniea]WJF95172.1 acyltransferase [Paraburkholderia bonniea]
MSQKIIPTSYFSSIQALRAIAALLVLAFHQYAVEGKYFGAHAIPHVLGLFGTCGVDLFFVISGFVMTRVTRGRFASREQSKVFLLHRFLRVYPIYWFYSLIVLAVMLVMPQWVNATTGHQANLLSSFLLLPSSTLPLLLQGWTLTYEMFFYLVFAGLVAFIAERFLPVALLIWAILTGGLAFWLGRAQLTNPFLEVVSNPLVLEFIGGCFCALLCPAVKGARSIAVLVIGLAALLAAFVIGEHAGLSAVVQWRALYFGVPACLLVLGATSWEMNTGRTAPRFLRLLGDASYSLYLSHVLVISAVGRLYAHLAPAALPAAFGTLLCLCAAIASGYLGYRLIEQPLNSKIRQLVRRSKFMSAA